MPDRLTCEAVASRELIPGYVAGRLTEEEAEALEAHSLECQECWSDLQTALEVRAALSGGHSVGPAGADGRQEQAAGSFRLWNQRTAILVAAAAVILAMGLAWQWQQAGNAGEPILRGPGDAMKMTLSWSSDGTLDVAWAPRHGATTYRVSLFDPAGGTITEEVTSPTVQFPAHAMRTMPNAVIQIEALNAAGEVIGRGARTSVPPAAVR